MSNLSENQVAELACTYAALALHDDNVPITAEKISALLKAANVNVQPYWAGIFARVLAKANLDDLINNAGGSAAPAAAPAGGAAPAAAGGAPAKKEEKKKEEPKEEEDEDMGFGLFD
eukprot:TRINITY_DN4852_c3_g1_i1.p2 TRINITY_DN4852_c3_g1~~TRINITY_DN4852_c3_g1_i1.p2  ORF type:complete len:117 (+),score=47.33 TRINITY_DN4852_c3_g1_i1:119-469(+)